MAQRLRQSAKTWRLRQECSFATLDRHHNSLLEPSHSKTHILLGGTPRGTRLYRWRSELMTVRVAVIGAGALGRCQAMALADYEFSDLVSICDLDEGRAKALAADVGCAYTASLADLETLDIDASLR